MSRKQMRKRYDANRRVAPMLENQPAADSAAEERTTSPPSPRARQRPAKPRRSAAAAERQPRNRAASDGPAAAPPIPRSAHFIADIVKTLDAMRLDVLADMNECTADLRALESAIPEEDDSARRTSQAVMVSAMAHVSRKLGAIDAALDRVRRGTYGACADCAEDIPEGRLLANPVATRCTRCQEADEIQRRPLPEPP